MGRRKRSYMPGVTFHPVRAGICGIAGAYRWSSFRFYGDASIPPAPSGPEVRPALELFAQNEDATRAKLQAGYLAFAADLRDLVLHALRELAPGLDLARLQSHRGGPQVRAIRSNIIDRAISAGHRNVSVARFLNVDEATVSRVASEVHKRLSEQANDKKPAAPD